MIILCNAACIVCSRTLFWSKKAVETVVPLLEEGIVLIGTSDTVLGFMAKPDQKGFDALNRIKKRTDKPYLVLVGSVDQALRLAVTEEKEALRSLMQSCWPGPVTLIMRAVDTMPVYMKSTDGTIAVRFPDHAGLRMLLEHIPVLFSTSANSSGAPVPKNYHSLEESLCVQVPHIILDEVEKTGDVKPSTIIDCTRTPFKIVRQGSFSKDKLQERCPDIHFE